VLFAQLALTLLSLIVCAFAPGFFLIRRLRWSPMEKLCGSVGLSLILVWLAAWVLYLVVPGAGAVGAVVITAGSAVLLALAWKDVRKLFGADRVRHSAIGFGFLLLWTLVILATIRHISGAGWVGDWLEHFQRSLVFLHHLPKETEIFGGYRIPSRPPMAHVITALMMAQTQDRFEIFQVVFAFLSLLVFLPCCLMLPLVARPWKSGVLPLACIFAMSPLVMVNATYTGTKPLAAFFAVLAVAFYLRGWKKQDRVRMSAAFLAAAGGVVAHYSAAPYAAFLGLHYLIAVFPSRRERWKELASLTAVASVPLLAWFGWCFAAFSMQGTLSAAANTSVAYGQTYEGSYLVKSLANLFDAIVPHVLRDSALVHAWGQPNTLGYIRDNAFLIYQTSLIFTMGLLGGPLVLWFLFRALRRSRGPARNFWLAFIPFSVAACFALVGERDRFGVAHITLYAMLAIGLAFLAANFTPSRAVSLLIMAGCVIDFSLGVFLQARVEHLENTAQQTAFPRIMIGKVRMDLAPAGPDALSRTAGNNWFRKHQYALATTWLVSLARSRPGNGTLEPGQATIRDALQEVVRQDETLWGGWYRRNGGEIVFLGDHFGDSDWTSVLMVLGCFGLVWKMVRYALPAVAAAPVKSNPARVKAKR
jgi:hypothetical protein